MRFPGRLRRLSFALAAALALCAAACATPVSAEHVGAPAVYRAVHENGVTGLAPSAAARLVIERAGLADAWARNPGKAIVALHRAAEEGDLRERLFGLAELSLVVGKQTDEQKWFLGAAVYAYLYLFGQADAPPPGPFDPRFRLACDIYERGLARAFPGPHNGEFRPQGGVLALPVGSITLDLPSDAVRIGDAVYDDLRCANEYAVHGMRSRVRIEGLGVPLIAGSRAAAAAAAEASDAAEVEIGRVPKNLRVAGAAVLDVTGEFADLAAGRAKAALALHSGLTTQKVTVRGATVPLALDFTAPVAYGLTTSRLWGAELFGFLYGDDSGFKNGLFLMRPYERGKIPLVLVHGTASSPARWAELLNEMAADPAISKSYQPWLFLYNTGPPVLVSAASLRKSLDDTIRKLDPRGEDAALSRIVVMGHSQGGLLTRLMVTSSGEEFWHNFSDKPIDALELEPDERKLLTDAMFFEPVPQVERVIFLATPHCGSYVAGNFFGRIGSALVSLPRKVVTDFSGIVARNVAKLTGDKVGSMPTAVDNMEPGSPFCGALGRAPVSPRVKVNSIVAVDGDGPPEEGGDGVVMYTSAHYPAAESEFLVRSAHSCQGDPRTILEVRRILHLHADSAPSR